MSTSMQQCVVQEETDTLFLRALDSITNAPVTLAGTHTITIFSPGNAEVVPVTSTGISVSGHTLSYQRTWDLATFPRSHKAASQSNRQQRQWYRAKWSLNNGDIIRQTYFEIVRRRFLSQLTDADFSARHPSVIDQLDSGISDLSTYRQRAWERITHLVQQRTGRNAGDLFLPETFSLCHEHWTLADFYLNNMFDAAAASEDRYKHEHYEKLGMSSFESAMAQQIVDVDDDGIAASSRETYHLNGVRVRR